MKLRVFAIPLFLFLLHRLAAAQDPCAVPGPNVGTAYFNHIINWNNTGDATFHINGAPPNVCGNLATYRNGSCLYVQRWICTDTNGNASGGPYRWIDQLNDQTDVKVHFDWPNLTSTFLTTNHYWDKTCPTPTITSPTGRPPNSFSGNGADGMWGAGFGSWTKVKLQFQDTTSGYFWNPSSGFYDSVSPPDIFANVSGLGTIGPGTSDSPSYNITWSAPTVPNRASHDSGDSYVWTVIINDDTSQSACATSQSLPPFTCGLHSCQ